MCVYIVYRGPKKLVGFVRMLVWITSPLVCVACFGNAIFLELKQLQWF